MYYSLLFNGYLSSFSHLILTSYIIPFYMMVISLSFYKIYSFNSFTSDVFTPLQYSYLGIKHHSIRCSLVWYRSLFTFQSLCQLLYTFTFVSILLGCYNSINENWSIRWSAFFYDSTKYVPTIGMQLHNICNSKCFRKTLNRIACSSFFIIFITTLGTWEDIQIPFIMELGMD